VAATLAVPGAAMAKKQPVYQLQLSGDESVAWQYKAPPDGCFYGATGNGSQQVAYKTGKVKVVAVKPKAGELKGLVQLTRADNPAAKYGIAQTIPATIQVDREGDIQSSAGCGGTGHSTQQPPPPDCGTRWGRVSLEVGWHNLVAFGVGGHYDNFDRPAPGPNGDLIPPVGVPQDGEPLSQTYEDCPLLLPSGLDPANDNLTLASYKISQRKLPKKGKTLKISGGDQNESADPDGQRTAQTSVAWNLKLKRIK
jgi:hypothetical protein